MELTPETIALGVVAAFVVGLTKTGLPGIGVLAVALVAMVFPGKEAVGAILPILIAGDVFAMVFYHRSAQWDRLRELLPCVLAGMVVGGVLLWKVSGELFTSLLGGLILFLLLLELVRSYVNWARDVPRKRWFTFFSGGMAGLATTLGNAAGPIMNIYLLSRGLEKRQFMGTIAWYYFLINLLKVPLYAGMDLINLRTCKFDLLVLPAVVLGAFAGKWLLHHINMSLFRQAILALAALAALRLIFM